MWWCGTRRKGKQVRVCKSYTTGLSHQTKTTYYIVCRKIGRDMGRVLQLWVKEPAPRPSGMGSRVRHEYVWFACAYFRPFYFIIFFFTFFPREGLLPPPQKLLRERLTRWRAQLWDHSEPFDPFPSFAPIPGSKAAKMLFRPRLCRVQTGSELSDATNGTRVWGKWRIQGTIVVGTRYRVDLLL